MTNNALSRSSAPVIEEKSTGAGNVDIRRRRIEALAIPLLAVLLYIVADFFVDLPPTALEFRSEVVRAEPHGDTIRFAGEYHFFAHHPRRRSYEIGFPTQLDSQLASPRDVEVTVDGRPIPFTILKQGLSFSLPVEPGNEIVVTTAYTLDAPGHHATYITHTANLWPEPIAEARFVLPDGAKSNYHDAGATDTLRLNFRSTENWNVEWE